MKNLRQRKAVAKLNTILYAAATKEPTQGNFQCTEGDATFNTNGDFRNLLIKFSGNVYIKNTLPDGYSIKVTKNIITIRNILNKKLQDDLLFRFEGSFSPSKVIMGTFTGKQIVCNVFDRNLELLIGQSKTKFEDDTIIFRESLDIEELGARASSGTNTIDDDSIRGLYTKNPINGYTGYYNYHPRERIYMTGKRLTNNSKPIGKNTVTIPSFKVQLKKVYNKLLLINTKKADYKDRQKKVERDITKTIQKKATKQTRREKKGKGKY